MTSTRLLGVSFFLLSTACGETASDTNTGVDSVSPTGTDGSANSASDPTSNASNPASPSNATDPDGPVAMPSDTVDVSEPATGGGSGDPTVNPTASTSGPATPSSQAGAPGAGAGGTGGGPEENDPTPSGGTGNDDPSSTGATPVERHGQLRVDGNRLVDAQGTPVTLRGQGFGWDNWWPQYYNAQVVDWLADDWCVDIVRPAMGIEPDGAYLQNPDASGGRVRAVVDAAIARGVYVIIDWHAHDAHQSEAIAFFSQMAESYGGEAAVIYEIFNEPDDETWPEVKAYAEAVIAAIRQHDPDNLVIVGSTEWDQRIDLVAADPITSDDNVIYSVHFYAATHGSWLRERAAAAMQSGIPLLVSESSGSEAAGTGANDYAEWEAWVDFMDQNQISWLNYSVSDKAGETISVLEPGASASGGWDASQLTETGEYIRGVFRSYCP